MTTIVIAIARQLGAGGAPLGKRLAQRLNFKYLDDELLRMAAEKCGASAADLQRWDEHRARFWERVGGVFSMGAPDAGANVITPPPGTGAAVVIHDREVFALQSEVIREAAARHDCVIIGRAGFWVLRDHPGRIAIYLHAPAETRIPAVMETFKVDAAKARELIVRIDDDRTRFVRETTGQSLLPTTQDLCINTATVPLEQAEELVVQAVELRRKQLAS